MTSTSRVPNIVKHKLYTIVTMTQRFYPTLCAALLTCCVIVQLTLRNGELLHSYGPNNGIACDSLPSYRPFDEAGTLSVQDRLHLEVDRLRFEIAKESLRMMMEDTEEAAKRSHTADISAMVELMVEALHSVGVRQVHDKMLTTQEFAVALTDAAKSLGIKGFRTEQKKGDDQPMISYLNVPSDRKFGRTKPSVMVISGGCVISLDP
ncbi:MAG: hypothetical protein HC944_04970 [Nanoarchaeota archaeon]|nr:hypothetical protein [Nanoarchaeota archaeon]